jgi:hypothetical protein
MTRLLLAIFLFISSVGFSQDTLDNIVRRSDSLREETRKREAYSDSVRRKEEIDRMTSRSVDYFVNYQKQQRERQKKQAMLYIGIGIFFLIVLIVGLRRRIKK